MVDYEKQFYLEDYVCGNCGKEFRALVWIDDVGFPEDREFKVFVFCNEKCKEEFMRRWF